MPPFKPWDIVKVPFPYTDRPVRQRRPALVVAAGELETHHNLVWLLMITSAGSGDWPTDVPVSDLAAAGLPAPSVIRTAKIAAIDPRDAEPLGTLPEIDRPAVATHLIAHLASIVATAQDT